MGYVFSWKGMQASHLRPHFLNTVPAKLCSRKSLPAATFAVLVTWSRRCWCKRWERTTDRHGLHNMILLDRFRPRDACLLEFAFLNKERSVKLFCYSCTLLHIWAFAHNMWLGVSRVTKTVLPVEPHATIHVAVPRTQRKYSCAVCCFQAFRSCFASVAAFEGMSSMAFSMGPT